MGGVRITPQERDALGEKCKAFEMAEAGRKAMPGLPLLARLDGRAFHTFTRGLARPFDPAFSACMADTTASLVEEFHATVGYTQSDEISLAWRPPENPSGQFPFDGRFQKLCSVLAGHASARFAQLIAERLPAKREAIPAFDCRVWQVPTLADTLDVFVWREDDAVKNSITMLAQAHFSHRELHGQGSGDKLAMLDRMGIRWQEYATHFKRGLYFRRVTRERTLTFDERERIPIQHRPPEGETFLRSAVEVLDIAPIRREPDAIDRLFSGEPRAAPSVAPLGDSKGDDHG